MKPQNKGDYPLAERIRYLRGIRGLTQDELAKAAGLSQSALAQFETGRREPLVSTLQKLAEALDIAPALFFRTDDVMIFDLPRLKKRYPTLESLPEGLHRDLSVIYHYARKIGFG